jgi:SAM-dependent methyltransferase
MQRGLSMKVRYGSFSDRRVRSAYIADNFSKILSGRVLDVGCDKRVLKKLLPNIDYLGTDIGGEPDIKLNLEKINFLPFVDGAFDCVLCSDVLEHLDNLHHIFTELLRVSNRYVIISLPNNWTNARKPIERGYGSFDKYGLPPQPPVDRHKWFFSLTEGIDFIKAQVAKHPVTLVEEHVTEKPRPFFVKAFRRILYPSQERYLNRYAHTLWVVLEKKV